MAIKIRVSLALIILGLYIYLCISPYPFFQLIILAVENDMHMILDKDLEYEQVKAKSSLMEA